jgi:lysophospholipase L1-like esterase
MRLHHIAASLLLALPILAGCKSDDTLNSPNVIDPMFRRYAALGNSITAGFQSAGINDSTQRRAYPALLAAAMGTSYTYPSLNMPGCPPPLTNNVILTRVGGGAPNTCALKPIKFELLNNLAVPGNQVITLLNNFSGSPSQFDPLKTIMLGGRTEVELMMQLQPTFVTVWAGSNDVLGALIDATNPGDPAQVTPAALFVAQYDSLVDSLRATGANVVLIGVPDVTAIPFASLGAIWYCLKNGGCSAPLPPQDPTLAAIPTFSVAATCAPPGGVQTLVPWTKSVPKLGAALQGVPSTIDCSVDNETILPAELQGMVQAVAAYNQHIQQVAQTEGWGFFDIDAALKNLVGTAVPQFPDLTQVPTGGSVGFGPLFSLDGIHPSSVAQRVFADSIAEITNRTYGTTLPVPVCSATVACPAP